MITFPLPGFNQIRDVELRMAARRQAAEIKEQNAKAEKAGYEANDVRREQGYVFLDRTVPFIDGPATFNAALRKLLSVDPDAAEFVPNVYSPPNAQRLQEFVSNRRKSVQVIGGVPTLLNENTGVASELGIRKFNAAPSQGSRDTVSLPAGVQPPTQAQIGALAPSLGGTPATPQMGMDPANMAAGTPADVGAMQSGVPGQRLPVAGGANFQSLGPAGGPLPASQVIAERQAAAASAAATAKGQETRAVESAKNQVSSEERRRGAAEVLAALSDPAIETLIMGSTSGYAERALAGAYGTATGSATSGMENIGQLKTIGSQLVTQVLGGKLGGGISNADVDLIKEGVADIGNPLVPANQRLSAFRQLLKNLEMISTGKPLSIASPARDRSPAVGSVENGYRFKGGDPSKPSSWEKM
jgi:hypothetical protein